MIINHNIASLNAYRNLTANNTTANKAMEKLSSGMRINRAGDDAAGLAISEKMRSQIRGLDQATRNAQDGISLVQTAEGALTEVHSMLQRMRELAVQSANDTNAAGDRTNLQAEATALATEIDRVVTSATFNGQAIFAAGAKVLQVGADGGATNQISLTIGAWTNVAGTAAATISTQALADGAITALDTAINTVSTTRSSLGAVQNTLEHTINNLSIASENMTAAESRIRDVDMAKEMTNVSKTTILSQAATAMLAQANQLPQQVLKRLQ
jgi:flagellin